MKLKAIVCVNLGLYMDLRTEILVDTENYAEAKRLVQELHVNFYGLLNGLPKVKEDVINETIQMDLESRKAYAKTDFKIQGLYDKVRKGEAIPFSEWDKLNESEQKFLHKAQLEKAQQDRLDKKDVAQSGKGK